MSENTKIRINDRCTIIGSIDNWTVYYNPEGLVFTVTTDNRGRKRTKHNGRAKYVDSLEGALKKYADLELRHHGEFNSMFEFIQQVKKIRSEIETLIQDRMAV